MRILFTILTCNRLHYLKNCLNSILKFADIGDEHEILIVDNNTIESGEREFFSSLPENINVYRFQDRVPNELYRAMNYAVEYCRENDFEIVNFIQDDYQYIYKNENTIPSIVKCFKKYKKVGQININMIWKRKRVGRYYIKRANGIKFAFLQDKRLVDNGFTRVSLYKKTGLYPVNMISYDQNSEKTFGFGKNRYSKKRPNGEIWFGKKCSKLGYFRAISLFPDMAMMFDCSYVRGLKRFGNYFHAPNEFYLKPFGIDNVNLIKKRHDKNKFCFIEKMITPDGWCPQTYGKHNEKEIIKQKIISNVV